MYALIYSIPRDTGIRPVEISRLTLNDIGLENGILSICSAKHGNPRNVKVKASTLAMLKVSVQSHNFRMNEELFPDSAVISNTFCRLRTSIARKLQNNRIRKIRLYDFRHYYATTLYFETKDLLSTKEMLGHRNIQNALVYTHLVRMDFEEKYYSATAKPVKEASKLIEQGFDHVTEFDSVKLFRKRKWLSSASFFLCKLFWRSRKVSTFKTVFGKLKAHTSRNPLRALASP